MLEAGAAAAVIFAGVIHATWNTMVKTGDDRTATLALVMAGAALPWIPVAVVLPLPAVASWPFIAASFFIHLFYYAFLLAAYRTGDLSQVYPIARGMAPALVATGAWLFAGEALSLPEAGGIALVCLGILSLAWRRGGLGGDARSVFFAVLTAFAVGGYIVADGMGVRRSGEVFAYIAWVFLTEGFAMAAICAWLRRRSLAYTVRRNALRGLLGGLLSSLSYGITIWAMSFGGMAHVAALRETSVLVAAVIGTRLLGEPFGTRRVAAAAAVACGAVVLQGSGAL
ncbi:EamA family transporter [Ferruginivarius sediminum]|uniref:EamA family transporter n=1 Tax=Ferruginivarius sediminum TaxID=2661937 RepID=A0A369TDT3_9PROT|nr:EamA family transporter [Ferruginivarius sediminum]RDD63489.1 EamA family transporter [Ferruginivarius sediminum]